METVAFVVLDPGPEYLYRYRTVGGDNLDHLRRTLLEHEVYLASPRMLNDPFECQIRVDGTGLSKGEWRKIRNHELRYLKPQLTRAERQKLITEEVKRGVYKDPDYFGKAFRKLSRPRWTRLAFFALLRVPTMSQCGLITHRATRGFA